MIIKAVGDICPGDKLVMGMGVYSKSKKYSHEYPLKHAIGDLKKSDLALANLEGLLTEDIFNKEADRLTFCGMPNFARALVDAGIEVVSVANNHTLEHGEGIFKETVSVLKNASIKVCGLRSKSDTFYSEPVIVEKNGCKIGVLGYNWVGVTNFENADDYIAQSRNSLVNYTWNREKKEYRNNGPVNEHVHSDIQALRSEVDFLILMAHWGYEFVTIPPYGVTVEARSFIDSGVDLIIGGHPHVLQGVEKYKQALIFYSLGNFVFDFRRILTRYTCVAEIELVQNKIVRKKIVPYFINSLYQPQKANKVQSDKIRKLIKDSEISIYSPDKKNLLNDDRVYQEYEKYYNSTKIFTIIYHFILAFENPKVFKLIGKKIMTFLQLIHLRIKGSRVRW